MQDEVSMQKAETASKFSNWTKPCGGKKPYASPLLRVYGTVSQATKGSTGLILDGGGILNMP
jgi:hypothetical protein